MPPLHPAFVHFPIALMTFSFITDLLGRLFNKRTLSNAGFWCLIGAILIGAITVLTGLWDFRHAALGETARYADFHQDVGFILAGSLAVLALLRWLVYARRDRTPGIIYLILALIVTCLTLFQGWYGGAMVYSQGAGVSAAGKGTEPADVGKQQLDKITK